MAKSVVNFYVSRLMGLVGGKITHALDVGDGFFGFRVQLPDGRRKDVIVMCDEEGNGPGAIDIQDPEEGGREGVIAEGQLGSTASFHFKNL